VTVWHDIDERVLLWLAHEAPASFPPWALNLTIRPDDTTSEEIPGLTDRQVDQALLRLESYGLVDFRERSQSIGCFNTLRVTALGHRVLGVWPDLEHIAAIDALRLALQAVADGAPLEERSTLRRAVGIAGELGGAIVASTAAGTAGKLGDNL